MNDKKFSKLSLSNSLLQVLDELSYKEMTPIQEQSLPVLLKGQDIIGQAKTGSGKTASFSLPLLEKLQLSERKELQGLILCPTRELCAQVAREIRKLGRRIPNLQVLEVVGGVPAGPQLSALRKGVPIIVGTPGRVLDLINRRAIDLSNLYYLVLDEADRMLDMGFEEEMNSILLELPSERQTALFSATFPESIAEISERFQKNPVRITILEEESKQPDIEEIFIPAEDKFSSLMKVLQQYKPESTIIFCNFKASVAQLAEQLYEAGISADALHGDLDQPARDRVMAKFRNHSLRVLVATDVAARGIDVADLDLVVNFELPEPETYTHRIGRTGRAGKKGCAVTLQGAKESKKRAAIESARQMNYHDEILECETPRVLVLDAPMGTIFIGGGRKDKVRPGDILGALTGEAAGLNAKDIGKIEIHDLFTYVAITKELMNTTIEKLRLGKIKGRKFRIEPVK